MPQEQIHYGREENIVDEIIEPPMYKVIMHNDDTTTMDFVVEVLRKVFNKGNDEAVKLMLLIHHTGTAVCGVFVLQIAETKVDIVHKLAKEKNYPLQCTIELSEE